MLSHCSPSVLVVKNSFHSLGISSTMPQHRWSDEERACVLNWTDYCLHHGLNYMGSVTKHPDSVFSQNEWDREKIRVQLRDLARKYWRTDAGHNHSAIRGQSAIIEQGTRCLDLAKIPRELKEAMRSQRLSWKIATLEDVNAHIPLSSPKVS